MTLPSFKAPSLHQRLRRGIAPVALAALLAPALAQQVETPESDSPSLYKYRDVEGNWVFTDRRPDGARAVEQVPRTDVATAPEITVRRREIEGRIEIVATNNCFCPAEIALRWLAPTGVVPPAEGVHRVIPARRDTVVASMQLGETQAAAALGYEYRAVLGEPEARHAEDEGYRVPFAVSRAFPVTQAYPSRFTHVDPSSEYAVDIEMPVGTQIYAARSGTVIEVASNYFETTDDPARAMRANIIRVLHADGTMALYAHLNWDSIRVRAGQRLRRGEYIADSGNTGFSTGPHLHFAVQRNAGLRLESVPFTFTGASGERVNATTGASLTAH